MWQPNDDEGVQPPEDQEAELSKLPPEMREPVRKLLKEVAGQEGFQGMKVMKAALKDTEHDDDACEKATPIRTVKMSKRVEKYLRECLAWGRDAKKKAVQLAERNKAIAEELQEIEADGQVRKANLWRLVDSDMDLPSERYWMRVNHETSEIEILEDRLNKTKPAGETSARRTAVRSKSKARKAVKTVRKAVKSARKRK